MSRRAAAAVAAAASVAAPAALLVRRRRARAALLEAAARRTTGARPRVVVVGAGFAGLAVARTLRGAPVETVVVDQHNYHLFQPLLYQVAAALLDPSEIAHPVRAILRRTGNATFRLGRVTDVDLAAHRVHTDRGDVDFDHLVVAAGSVNNFFGNHTVEERAHTLKDLGGGLALRNHVLACFERASWTDDPAERERLLTFTVVGGGPTGVEYSGALSELIRLVLLRDFPGFDPSSIHVRLVEAAPELLASFAPPLRRSALDALRDKGVEVLLGRGVSESRDGETVLEDGTVLPGWTVVWTAGVRAAPLGGRLGIELGSQGRVPVGADLRLAGHPEVYVAGDLAERRERGEPLPMLAPVAIQQGEFVGRTILASLAGLPSGEFRYRDKGTMATIGRNDAVAQIGPLRLDGFPGWVAWLVVHLVQLIGFRSRIVVLVNWAWDYFFYDRPVRLITGPAEPHGETMAPHEEALTGAADRSG